MNKHITKYPQVSDKRLEEKIKTTADKEDVSMFLELALLRGRMARDTGRPYERHVNCGQ